MTSSLLARAAASSALLAGACLLAAGCSAGDSSASSSAPMAVPARAAAGSAQSAASEPGSSSGGTSLTALPATESIIYTASVTVRTAHLTQAAARATQLARAAGGYVSTENTALNRAHPDRSKVSLQLKIPVSSYKATLGALSTQLGRRLAMSQHAQDVTQTVADVTSRVTSAGAAISQLRSLLRHAGSVGSLLTVQNQINDEESTLESLLARQRALTHETSFGTVNILLVAPSATTMHKKHHPAGGFVGGLKAGWHGLVRTIDVLLTGAGAALVLAVILAILGGIAAAVVLN
ncbi:MAG: DUF4349 domain-containing protein, partial [Streptosporangiaceae bacterium]